MDGVMNARTTSHDADRISHPVYEVGDHQAWLVQPRVLRWHTDLGRALSIQRQHGFTCDGVIGSHSR